MYEFLIFCKRGKDFGHDSNASIGLLDLNSETINIVGSVQKSFLKRNEVRISLKEICEREYLEVLKD